MSNKYPVRLMLWVPASLFANCQPSGKEVGASESGQPGFETSSTT